MFPWTNDTIRTVERESIRRFVEQHQQYLKGRVLDFGCGTERSCKTPQPYRDLVEGDYVPADIAMGNCHPIDGVPECLYGSIYDAILTTQVLQYVEQPLLLLKQFWASLITRRGYLVMSYPTSWTEIEDTDYWRFTKAGMELLLDEVGYQVIHHERRAEVDLHGFKFPLGYGVVARAS